MAKFGSALTASRYEAQKMIKEAVASSANLAEAMECVGAMYGIPASNIMVDDNLRSVKVINDNIVCPSNVSATNNVNTIVRSVSALLDQISARIDTKLNELQSGNAIEGRFKDNVLEKTDPSKGKVVSTHKDANGDPVIVYDSGIIDTSDTPEGRAKAKELRDSGAVPTPDLNPFKKKEVSYFSDEDNVTNGVGFNESAYEEEAYDISSIIGESAYFIDAMAKLGDTSELGKAIFTTHGYDCVRPDLSSQMVQEAFLKKKKSAKGKKVSNIRPEDIKYMKFDNSEIHKAIKLMNEVRKEQPDDIKANQLDIDKIAKSEKCKQAIKCLEKQFDCRLSIRWGPSDNSEQHTQAGTLIFRNEYIPNLTCSKSKGFQLGGKEIWIVNFGEGITGLIPDDPTLFGQAFIGILLHEIFHNIASMMRMENGVFITTLSVAVKEAASTNDPQMRREIVEKYVDSLNKSLDGGLSVIGRKMMVKRLLAVIATEGDMDKIRQLDKAVEDNEPKTDYDPEADRFVKNRTEMMKKHVKQIKHTVGRSIAGGIVAIILGAIFVVLGIIAVAMTAGGAAGVWSIIVGIFSVLGSVGIGGTGIGVGIATLVDVNKYKKIVKQFKDSKHMEEYYCDLMASMYKLPVHMFVAGGYGISRKYTFNQISHETMEDYIVAERAAYEAMMAFYPTPSERTWTSVTTAKKLLECKNLDKNVKAYLEWIVQNNDKILSSSIKDNYSQNTFDPRNAEDMDKHVLSLLKNNNVKVTEAAFDYLTDTSEYQEWVLNGMQTDPFDDFTMEYYQGMREIEYYLEAFETRTNVTGYADEATGKRILMFLPRLLRKLVELITKFLQAIGQEFMNLMMSIVTFDKEYRVNFDMKKAADTMRTASQTAKLFYDKIRDSEDSKQLKENAESFRTELLDAIEEINNGKEQILFKNDSDRVLMSGRTIIECTKDITRDQRYMKPFIEKIDDTYTRIIEKGTGTVNVNDPSIKLIVDFTKATNDLVNMCMEGYKELRKKMIKKADYQKQGKPANA